MHVFSGTEKFAKMRWSVARSLLRENVVQKEVLSKAFSTTSGANSATQPPSRTLSSIPLPQEKHERESKISIKTEIPGIYHFRIALFRSTHFTLRQLRIHIESQIFCIAQPNR